MALLHYAPPVNPYLDIVYRDDDILVLDKPSGLLTVPGKAVEHQDSLQLRVQRVFPTASIVHRLDMATSGILVMALNKAAHRHLSRQFETRQTSKTYFARIFGQPEETSGTVDLPLICDWPNRPKQMVDHQRGKPSQTHWQVVETGPSWTLVKLTPVTGRSHQLRVHMLSLGHPILGDRLYAHADALKMAERLQLHAQRLQFNHPQTGQHMDFTTSCPFA
ncbi:bifunctional tRNA pseudouridine(32) synthase/23S rRNA pseudouridine(746) synthase RluA [Neptunicella sp. SCSIO 80796]|uniref:bifunctional tRNA pseudouridine(32) synthase/23S rRNA pseudouridine(746) synthase RluA n=1 Tax=Neptunicella plasticusilytica TaxID=3117012 RepID=UPI003A4E0DA5